VPRFSVWVLPPVAFLTPSRISTGANSSTFNDIQRQVCASTFQTMLLGCVSLPCPRPWPSGWQPSSQHSSSFCREPPPSVSSAARGTQLAAGLTNKEMPGVMCQVSGACLSPPPHTPQEFCLQTLCKSIAKGSNLRLDLKHEAAAGERKDLQRRSTRRVIPSTRRRPRMPRWGRAGSP